MPFTKKNLANNATCGLQFGIDENAMVFFATGNYNRFSTSNFVIEITTFDTTGKVTARENMLITSRTGNQFNVGTRAYERVPINDDATSNSIQALPFVSTNTIIKQVYSASFGNNLQDEVVRIEADKLDKTTYNAEKTSYSASSTGNDDYAVTIPDVASLTDGRTFKIKADVRNTGVATLNVNGLGAKTLKKLKTSAFADLETGDIIANQIFFATYNSSSGGFFQFSVDPAQVIIPDVLSTRNIVIAGENITAGNPVGFNYRNLMYEFTGTTIDTSTWSTTGSVSQNNTSIITPPASARIFSNQWKSLATYDESIELTADLLNTYTNSSNIYFLGGVVIYFDANNYIELFLNSSQWNNVSYVSLNSVKAGVSEYSANSASFGQQGSLSKSIKFTYNKTTGKINFYYLNGTTRTQVGTEWTTTFTGAFNIVMTTRVTGTGSSNFRIETDNLDIALLGSKKYCKANAKSAYYSDFRGFATNSVSSGGNVILDIEGVSVTQSGLTDGNDYFLSNTPGTISTSPGNILVNVGRAVSTTGIKVFNDDNYLGTNVTAGTTFSAGTAPTERGTTGTSPTKVKEILINKPGTYTISFNLRAQNTSNLVYGQIYKNGVAYGTLRSTTSTSNVAYSENLAFVKGDLVQIYYYTSNGGTASYVNTFAVTYALTLNKYNCTTNLD